MENLFKQIEFNYNLKLTRITLEYFPKYIWSVEIDSKSLLFSVTHIHLPI